MRKLYFLVTPLLFFPGLSLANDYPTLETVRYVVECMADLGGQNEHNLYTCTCRHDVVASQMPFADYERATFFLRYSGMPGKRGGLVRDSIEAKNLLRDLEKVNEEASVHCPAVKHIELKKNNEEGKK